jgi:serine protease inhibitor
MRFASAASALLGLLLVAGGCGQAPGPRPAAQVCSQSPPPASASGDAFAAGSRTFGLALTARLAAASPDNVFVSPLSAQLALAMAATGARGDTQRAMLDTLGLGGLAADRVAPEAAALMDRLASSNCVTVEIANGLWARRGLALDPAYVRAVRSSFRGESSPLDASSPKVVNDWVSRATHGQIPSILDRVPPDLLLYLVNATYFHGNWQVPFDAAQTRPALFHRAGAADVSVPLMDRSGSFAYGEGPDYQAIALPYTGGTARMVVILPTATLAPSAFAPYLDPARFQQVTGALEAGRSGEVLLPRFNLDQEASLLNALHALGMTPSLQPGADFSGIAPSCARRCFISDVTQRARLDVDERGTTAAAATRVGVSATAVLATGEPFRMLVDRPFLAAVQDTSTGTLLFAGVVGDPAAAR